MHTIDGRALSSRDEAVWAAIYAKTRAPTDFPNQGPHDRFNDEAAQADAKNAKSRADNAVRWLWRTDPPASVDALCDRIADAKQKAAAEVATLNKALARARADERAKVLRDAESWCKSQVQAESWYGSAARAAVLDEARSHFARLAAEAEASIK